MGKIIKLCANFPDLLPRKNNYNNNLEWSFEALRLAVTFWTMYYPQKVYLLRQLILRAKLIFVMVEQPIKSVPGHLS